MKKNWIERFGERKRKIEEANKILKEKYWKLPAADRIHYDSICYKINSRWRLTYISFSWLKMCVLLPLFLVLIGFFTGSLETFLVSSKSIAISLIKIFPLVFFIDICTFIYYLDIANPASFKKLNRRFKLIK